MRRFPWSHLEYFPAPLAVDGVARDLVEHEEGLGGLWSQDVVGCR